MPLTGSQFKQLQQALLSAFPTSASLAQMVRFGLDENLDAIASGSLSSQVFQLITWAESRGKTALLLEEARRANPGNPDLTTVQFSVSSPTSTGASSHGHSSSQENRSDAVIDASDLNDPARSTSQEPRTSPRATPRALRRQALEQRYDLIAKQYTAVMEQAMSTLNSDDRVVLEQKASNFERQLEAIDTQLKELEAETA